MFCKILVFSGLRMKAKEIFFLLERYGIVLGGVYCVESLK